MNRGLVVLGTDHHPFDRLIDWAATAQVELGWSIAVQHGSTAKPPDVLESFDYLAPKELAWRMSEADVVVCHGGPGTIAMCHGVGKRPIVVPRDPDMGEHVDDHQKRFADLLAKRNEIDLALDYASFVRLLSSGKRSYAGTEVNVGSAVEKFTGLVDQLLADELPRRRARDRFLFRRTL